jgi:predicted permease
MGRVKNAADVPRLEAMLNAELRQWLPANEPPTPLTAKLSLDRQHIALTPAGGGIATMMSAYDRDLRLLLAITGLVLLIACANLANLQLARGAASRAQTSIRVALGAPRFRLVRQMMIESLILSVVGGVVGLLVAMQLGGALLGLAFESTQYVPIDSTPSLAVLGFTFLLSMATGVVFGAAPAWSASKADPAAVLHGAARVTRDHTFSQKSLVVAQAGLSLVLLAGAGLMTQTMRNLEEQKFGFDMESAVSVNVNAGFAGYAPAKLAAVYAEVERKLRQIAGVREASAVLYSPMSGNNWQMGVTLEDQPDQQVPPSWDRVSPSFFRTIGARVVRGRAFDERDAPESTHVAVVNETFAAKYFANQNPLGKRFGLGGREHRSDYEIVGVVNDIRFRNPRQAEAPPMFFLPLLQMSPAEWANSTKARSNLIGSVILRVGGNAPELEAEIHSALGAIDPNLTVLSVTTAKEMLGGLVRHERLIARLAALFGVLALLLASVGLYGITQYNVSRRTTEIGVRTALGATRGNVVRLVLSGALAQIAIGLAIGIPAALAGGRVLAGQLYGVEASDPVTLAGAAAVLAVSAVAAGLAPALRAGSIDPVQALRSE